MKNTIITILIILVTAIFESTVGLPVLTFVLFLIWMNKEQNLFLVWLALMSLCVGVLWGVSLWLSCLFLLILRVIYDHVGNYIANKILRLAVVVIPVSLLFSTILGIDFYWRSVVYGVLSFTVLFTFQKYLLVKHENHYL